MEDVASCVAVAVVFVVILDEWVEFEEVDKEPPVPLVFTDPDPTECEEPPLPLPPTVEVGCVVASGEHVIQPPMIVLGSMTSMEALQALQYEL